MAGNVEGGLKASKKNKKLYGKNFYQTIGQKGGRNGSRGKGFSSILIGADGLTGRERARIAGARGGSVSSRAKKTHESDPNLVKRALGGE